MCRARIRPGSSSGLGRLCFWLYVRPKNRAPSDLQTTGFRNFAPVDWLEIESIGIGTIMARANSQFDGFRRFFAPMIDILKDLGGSARPSEVCDAIAERLQLTDEELNEQRTVGGSLYENQVHWARLYLTKTGYISSSKRGVWALTKKGQGANLTDADVMEIYREVLGQRKRKRPSNQDTSPSVVESSSPDDSPEVKEKHRPALLAILRALPAPGFERLCQRLLREGGFQQVIVTGRSGDGGIDGHGILQVNAMVSFRVYFQCKRYKGSVGPGAVRDFRGAMMGRADKGIILTTGTFTADAKKEAVRDGVPPVELVDGEKLIDMFEQLELGLQPVKTYEVVNECATRLLYGPMAQEMSHADGH